MGKSSVHTFIIWETARCHENEIIDLISSKLNIISLLEIEWTRELFEENLTSFYEEDFRYNCFNVRTRGKGAFILIIAEDSSPSFHMQKTRRGMERVCDKAYQIKKHVRDMITHTYNFHASINEEETRSNIVKLLGINLYDYPKQNVYRSGKIKRDCMGIHGWDSLRELFYVLNETCKYVVLRGYDALPDKHYYSIHGDIDILVENLPAFLCILHPSDIDNKFQFYNWMDIGEQRILIHPKYVGDHYYDSIWQKRILSTRELNSNDIYIPNTEMLFWSLLYHGLFHKDNYIKYSTVLKNIAFDIGIKWMDDKGYLCYILSCWLLEKRYHCRLHLDLQAGNLLKENIYFPELIDETAIMYSLKSEYNGNVVTNVVLDENLIRVNPILFSTVIGKFDSLFQLDNYILDSRSFLYGELVEHIKKNEFFWKISQRGKEISILSFTVQAVGKGIFNRKFLGTNRISDCMDVVYIEENDVPFYKGELLDCYLAKIYLKKDIESVVFILTEYMAILFSQYQEDDDYLSGNAWDVLSCNVFYDNGKYYFFDKEAVYKNKIDRGFVLANTVRHLSESIFAMEEFEAIGLYKKMLRTLNITTHKEYKEYVLEQRNTVNNIFSFNLIKDNEEEYRNYLDASVYSNHIYEVAQRTRQTEDRLLKLYFRKIWPFPFQKIKKGSKVILYGAGEVGQDFRRQIVATDWAEIVLWVDARGGNMQVEGIPVGKVEEIGNTLYDYVIISISSNLIVQEIKNMLISNEIEEYKIITL